MRKHLLVVVLLATLASSSAAAQTRVPPLPGVEPLFRPTSFLDHFDRPELGRHWVVRHAAGGTVTLSGDSFAIVRAPGAAGAAYLQYAAPLDTERPQTWLFCVRRVSGDNLPAMIALWSLPDGAEPLPGAAADVAPELRAAISFVVAGGTPRIRFQYLPSATGLGPFWRGEPDNVWTVPGDVGNAIDKIRQGPDADWYVVGFQIDVQGVRFFGFHRVATALGDTHQGLRLVALTDWVGFEEFGDAPIENLWLTIGDRYDDRFSGEYNVEWVRFETGAAAHGWTNARATSGDFYTLRHTAASGGNQFLPEGRGVSILDPGTGGAFDARGHRKKHVIRDDDGVYLMFYEGFDPSFESSIGLASAPGPDGPWTPAAGNPVVPRTLLPAAGADYDALTAPWIVKDNLEPDPAKRWRLFACGEVRDSATHRMFLFSAPDPAGPWVLEPGLDVDGSILAETGDGGWKDQGACDPVVAWNRQGREWVLLYSGIRVESGWSVGFARSQDLIDWFEPSPDPIIVADSTGLRSWTAVDGKTITITDASGFVEDAAVVIRNETSAEEWGISRVRRIHGNDLELYHEIGGLGGTSSNRSVGMLGAGSITAHALARESDGRYRLYVTVFQPFILGIGAFGNCEVTASLTAPLLSGPWEWDRLASPNAPLTIWEADRSQENLELVNHPAR